MNASHQRTKNRQICQLSPPAIPFQVSRKHESPSVHFDREHETKVVLIVEPGIVVICPPHRNVWWWQARRLYPVHLRTNAQRFNHALDAISHPVFRLETSDRVRRHRGVAKDAAESYPTVVK